MVRREVALSALWTDRCDIFVSEAYEKESGAAGQRWTALAEGEPCKLSFFNQVRVNETAGHTLEAAPVRQVVKLFLRPGLPVPPGSRVEVARRGSGTPRRFEAAGIPEEFSEHQEIQLVAAERWS